MALPKLSKSKSSLFDSCSHNHLGIIWISLKAFNEPVRLPSWEVDYLLNGVIGKNGFSNKKDIICFSKQFNRPLFFLYGSFDSPSFKGNLKSALETENLGRKKILLIDEVGGSQKKLQAKLLGFEIEEFSLD